MSSEPARRPNLLLIMDDQHRFDFLGCAGAGFVRTPNMDRLAEQGVRFTHCCTNAPICAPARIALATGMQPGHLGATGNDAMLPADRMTYYQRLRDHQYHVGCVGKLDLAKSDKYNGRHGDRPRAYGFGFTHPVECEGKMHAGGYPTPQGPYGFWLQEQGLYERFHQDYKERQRQGWALAAHDSVLPADAFEDAYIGRRAAEWIERTPGDFPWHLFVSFVGPHDPYDPPADYARRYRDAVIPPSVADMLEGKPAWARKRALQAAPEQVAHARRQYCASIEVIDDAVARILEALERRGMRENTLIVFTSDHGEMLGDHGMFQKHVPYEPSLRVPLICSGPGLPQGVTNATLVELIDVNPTLCEWAGLPRQEGIHARSLAPLLRGERAVHREDVLSAEGPYRLLRTTRHKYVEYDGGETELYDLERDPHELENLASRDSDLCKQLKARLHERLRNG